MKLLACALAAFCALSSVSAAPHHQFKQHGGTPRGKLSRNATPRTSTFATKRSDGSSVQFNEDPDAMTVTVAGDDCDEPQVQLPGEAAAASFRDAAGKFGGKTDQAGTFKTLIMPTAATEDEVFLLWQTSRASNPLKNQAGKTTVSCRRKNGAKSSLKFSVNSRGSDYKLTTAMTSEYTMVGKPLEYAVGATRGSLVSVAVNLMQGDAVVQAGSYANGVASVTPAAAGDYQVVIDAVILRHDGLEVERTQNDAVHVLADTVKGVSASFELFQEEGADTEILAKIALDTSGSDTRFLFSADVMGSTGAVTTLGGMADLQDGNLEFLIQLDLFDESGATGPWQLHHVRVANPSGGLLFASGSAVLVESAFQSVPARGSSRRRLLSMPEETAEQKLRRLQQGRDRRPMKTQHTGTTHVLVHGYCSKDAWGQVWGDYASPKFKFTDFEKSRSHDEFAQLIDSKTAAAGISSCRISAHSQGGMASLHLYTYYYSCLDNAPSGMRLIQSVGTPYQGTALAGNLAAIGEIFGVGCGYNYDLTYSGASTWLSYIPYSARAKVWYRTTSFTDNWYSYDYCHPATDVMLSDPDDGTTEKAKGQLPGGNNVGHKEGWCHAGGMSHSPQYTDNSANSVANSNM